MVEIPKAYTIDYKSAVKYVYEFLVASPLFLVAMADWLLRDGGSTRQDRRTRWVLAVLIVAIPFGAVAFAKYRGAANSMLPALLAMVAFCALRLPDLLRRLEESTAPLAARRACAVVLALLLLATIFPGGGWIARTRGWDDGYAEVIAVARKLPGSVICPEDPTIGLYAKQHAGRSIFAEYDGHPENGAWSEAMPEAMAEELRGADYVVDVEDYWDDCINEPVLRKLGFRPSGDRLSAPTRYRIWRHEADAPAMSSL